MAASEGRCEDEGWRLRKDGSRFWANVVITALRDEQGNLRGFSKITRDMTERMQADVSEKRAAENALRTSEERLRLALDAGKMGVWEWNLRTNAVWWSNKLEQIHGLEPGTFEGTLEAFQRLNHPDDRELAMAAISGAVDARSEYEIEFRNVRPDGSIHWMTGKGKVYCDESGQTISYDGCCHGCDRSEMGGARTARSGAPVARQRATLADAGRDTAEPRVDRPTGRPMRLA